MNPTCRLVGDGYKVRRMDDVDVNDAAVKEAVQRACVDVGLPLSYRSAVSQMLRTPSSEWPACCGEGCFPCQQSLADATLRTLELLGRSPR
ncbi:hypothetical protein [Archangium violaceum]|uniref:hypothetical protein n=1 Tax=Archangium violaceum TaxID=83451 RepID=UPI001EF5B6B6|nr:hypothetical protein [Archangium violaceum]